MPINLNQQIFINYHQTKKGMVLIDILLAFSISIIFIATISATTIDSRQMFENAQKREELLNLYTANAETINSLKPYESLNIASSSEETPHDPIQSHSIGNWYGNEMFQVSSNVTITSNSSSTSTFSTTSNVLNFETVRIKSMPDIDKAPGTPLCSVDFGNQKTLGSFEYEEEVRLSALTPPSTFATITPIRLPTDPLLPLTDLEVRNGIAYLSADSSVSSDSDLLIVNISDPSNSQLISTINTGPGLTSIALAGKRIYATAPSTASQLHIIRLDGLNNPILEKKFKLPLPFATSTSAVGSTIFFNDNMVYLGTEKWAGDEFNIIDVTDPLAPVKVGGYEIDSKVNDIYVTNNSNKVTYMTASNQNQLLVLNIQDTTTPTLLNIFSPSGWERQEGKAISFFEQNLSFGRTSGGFDLPNDHEAFAWATTSTTTLSAPLSRNIPSGVYGIVKDRRRLYLATRQVNKEFQIFDSLLPTATASYSLPIAPQAMTCDGNKIYILAHNAPYVYEIEIEKVTRKP